MCTILLQNVALWDMAQVHSGYCEMGLLRGVTILTLACEKRYVTRLSVR